MSDDCKNPSGSLCAILFHFLNLEGIASHRAMWLSWNSPKWEMKHRTHIIGHSFLVMSPFPCLYDFTLPCQIFFSWRSTACNKTEFFLNPQRFSSDNSSAQWWQSQKWISKYANQKTTCTHDQPCQSSSQKFQLWKPTLSAQTLGNCGIGFSDSPTYFKVMSTPRHPSKVCTMLSSRSSISSYSRSRFSSAAFTAFSSCLKIIGMFQDAFKSHLLYSVPWFHSIVPTERLKQLRNDAGIKKASTWM